MPNALELLPTYGKLTLVSDKRVNGKVLAVCECGNERWCIPWQLASGNTKSCKECLDYSANAAKPDGKTHKPEYWVWDSMMRRCHDPKSNGYASYGGRGIVVCERWHTFENFYADMGPRPGGKREFSVERIDNDGPYSPENCKWLPLVMQGANKRNNKFVVYHGRRVKFLDLCPGRSADEIENIRTRIDKCGWSAEEAFDVPIGVRRKHFMPARC